MVVFCICNLPHTKTAPKGGFYSRLDAGILGNSIAEMKASFIKKHMKKYMFFLTKGRHTGYRMVYYVYEK